MDKKLRDLERRVAGGDSGAKKQLLRERMRIDHYHPVMFTFGSLGDPIYGSRWLTGCGLSSEHLMIGPVLPATGILRGMSVLVGRAVSVPYTVETWITDQVQATLAIPTEIKAAGRRDLLIEVPRLVPIGVRVVRDEIMDVERFRAVYTETDAQRSTFSAIYVNLEIWIPGIV